MNKDALSASEAAQRINDYFRGRCSAQADDYGNRVTVSFPHEKRWMGKDQFGSPERLDALIQNIEQALHDLHKGEGL